MRKHFLFGLTGSLALFLFSLNGLNAFQDSPKPPDGHPAEPGQRSAREPGERAFGTISSVGVDRLEIKKMDGTVQTLMVDDQTRYLQGGRDAQKKLGLEDLKPGDRVFVQGKTNDSKEFLASVVRRVTDQDMQRFGGARTGGEITSIDGNQIKVRNPWQGERTIVVNDQTSFLKDNQPLALKDLKVGDRIFALGQESNGQFVAARVMTGQFRRGAGRRGNWQEPPADNK